MQEPSPQPHDSAVGDLIDQVAWEHLEHNRGTAGDVPALLRALLASDESDAGTAAFWELEDLLYRQGGWVCSAATAAVPVLVELATAPRCPHRVQILELLGSLAEVARTAEEQFIDPGWPQAWAMALPVLVRLGQDTDPAVRRAAYSALARTCTDLEQVATVLQGRWPQETDLSCQVDLLYCLGDLLRPHLRVQVPAHLVADVGGWLTALLAEPDHCEDDGSGSALPPYLVLAATVALRWICPHAPTSPTVQEQFVTALRAADHAQLPAGQWMGPDPVRRVAHAIAEFSEDPTTRTALITQLIDAPSRITRHGAVQAATQLLSVWRSPTRDLLPLLARRLTDTDPPTRASAAYLLGCIGPGAAEHADVVAALLDDSFQVSARPDERISDIAVFALARMGDANCIPVLVRRLGRPGMRGRLQRISPDGGRLGFGFHSVHWGRELYLEGLPGITDLLSWLPAHLDHLLAGVRHRLRSATSKDERRAFCQVLTAWGPPAAAVAIDLRALLTGDTARWAAEALTAVTGIPHQPQAPSSTTGPGASATDSTDPHALRSQHAAAAARGDLWTQARTAHALWKATGDPHEAVPALTDILATATGETTWPVTIAAAQYLADIARAHPGPTCAAARPAAERIMADERRLADSGGWRAFVDDETLRRHAQDIVSLTKNPASA